VAPEGWRIVLPGTVLQHLFSARVAKVAGPESKEEALNESTSRITHYP
jgi:hypothetical protein